MTAKGVETSVTTTNTNSSSQDYNNLDDQLLQTSNDTPRFKPFTLLTYKKFNEIKCCEFSATLDKVVQSVLHTVVSNTVRNYENAIFLQLFFSCSTNFQQIIDANRRY